MVVRLQAALARNTLMMNCRSRRGAGGGTLSSECSQWHHADDGDQQTAVLAQRAGGRFDGGEEYPLHHVAELPCSGGRAKLHPGSGFYCEIFVWRPNLTVLEPNDSEHLSLFMLYWGGRV